ncbi:MAG: M20/M25/M40 family metallo-hydrolase [Elusimicrobia bacterium]|nr:M20/M25/M40 family metallo-hydrolase [Elusimicrobiota bacterium]MDE2236851.1 M20/M25/M40 family metallo-hydrolase [Elusimicrobiota bacterium]MDE2426876.1 M20/M25/M40 family metallo-hydrolase [Elusimicrobiota bacterium]
MDSEQALSYAREHQREFIEDLKALVAIPSVSFAGFDPANVAASAEAVAGLMRRRGLENVEILTVPGCHPYVYGERLDAPGKPTLLMYAHHDVQPPGREELWRSPPFTATERDGRLYGRGSADDKAGIVVTLAAVASYLRSAGRLPLNVKVIIEGEEEAGSEHLEQFLQKYKSKLGADIMVLTDTGNFDTGVPSITTALRGLVCMDVTVRSADHPLHSGMWGGPLVDPVQALAKMIASVTDKNGRLAVPGIHAKVRKLGRAEERSLKSLRYTEKDFRKQSGVLPKTRLLGGKDLLRSNWYQPSFSVNAIQASSRKDCANIINEAAWCHMGVRIVENMDPADTLRRLKAHLLKHAPWGVSVEFERESSGPAWSTQPDSPVFQAAARALAKGYGTKETVFMGCGGSIPFVGPFSSVLGGAPALLIGVEDPYTNPHSENESLHLGDFEKGIRGSIHLFEELGAVK